MLEAVVALPRPRNRPPALRRILAALDASADRAADHPGGAFEGVPVAIDDLRSVGFLVCRAHIQAPTAVHMSRDCCV